MIISASRRTDVPAFFPEWLLQRLREEKVLVKNQWRAHHYSEVSLCVDQIDGLVFWTKNPKPLMKYLKEIREMGHSFYFQFTLTPYGENIEPNLPPKKELIETFCELSEEIGAERVIWRYDPIFFTEECSLEAHQKAFEEISASLAGYTQRCVFSFLDLYVSSERRMRNLSYQVPSPEEQIQMAEMIAQTCNKYQMSPFSCSEAQDFSDLGILPSSCIDSSLIAQISGKKKRFIKDKNQREKCGCAESIDIGCYDTCRYECIYCYARQKKKIEISYDPSSPALDGWPDSDAVITKRKWKNSPPEEESLF